MGSPENREAGASRSCHENKALDRLRTVVDAWERYSRNDLSREEFEGTIAEESYRLAADDAKAAGSGTAEALQGLRDAIQAVCDGSVPAEHIHHEDVRSYSCDGGLNCPDAKAAGEPPFRGFVPTPDPITGETIYRRATPADLKRWRVGRKLGRTLYVGDTCVGMVDTTELAAAIVERMNETETR